MRVTEQAMTDAPRRLARNCDHSRRLAPISSGQRPGQVGAIADTIRTTSPVSDAARRHVAEDLAVTADEDDAVPGGVAFVPFHFLVGDGNSRPFRDDTLAVGDDGYVFVTAHLEAVGFKSIGFAATRHVRVVRLHQLLKPFTQVSGLIAPLSVVACQRRQRYQHEEDDDAEHAAYCHWVAMPGPVTLSCRSHGRAVSAGND